VPPPEPLPAEALDGHCHLDLIEEPLDEVLAAARAAGIRRELTIGTDLASSRWAAQCAADHEDVYAAVAVHPNETETAASSVREWNAALRELRELAGLPRVRAIGETGLDYCRDYASREVQQRWFRAHIDIAKESWKPLMIHDRDAHEDVLRILEEEGPPEKVVFHCFSGDVAMVKRCAEAGYVMSFAGNITFRNAQPLRDAAAAAPLDLLLAETDAPFLTPVPHRGKPNTPAMVAHTIRFLAELKQMPLEEFCGQLTATAARLYGPW
jgi:TatD DNase family protein